MSLIRSDSKVLSAMCVVGWAAAALHGQIVVQGVARPAAQRAVAPVRTAGRAGKADVHITSGRQVTFPCALKDGGGHQWDIQRYGTVGQGTNRAYNRGLYLYVNNSRALFSSRGRINASGDEVELGPYTRNNLRISRRVKVYRDRGLARWLDIFENPTSGNIAVSLRLYSNMISTVGRTISSSGKGTFTAKDTAFVTVTSVANVPALMHYVCSKRSKVRPTVTVQGNTINVYYQLTVPAGKTVVLCYFESQNRSAAALTKLMDGFRPYTALKDLPSSVRKLLINMPVSGGIGQVELNRSTSNDVVYTRHGDPIFGTIANESFRLETLFGTITMPAKDVVGLASAGEADQGFRVALVKGQVIAGKVPKQAAVQIELPSGGTLKVPFGAVRQCAYRISKDKPEEAAFAGPLIVLRTGDRVAFEPDDEQFRLRTRHGTVDLDPDDLLRIVLDRPGNGVHRAIFLNGSQLAGFLEPKQIPLALKIGPELTIGRELVAQVQFAEEQEPHATLDSVLLSNDDELFGRFAEQALTLETKYGKVTLHPESIRAMSFSRTHLRRVSLTLWNGSVLRGHCDKQTLAFQITPGPTLGISIGQYVQVRRSQALPPKEVREKLRRWVGQLGAESYKDREAATEALIKMGKGVVPLLREYLDTSDPEVRQRIEEIIERLGARPAAPAPPAALRRL
jgi:hypothetical protein